MSKLSRLSSGGAERGVSAWVLGEGGKRGGRCRRGTGKGALGDVRWRHSAARSLGRRGQEVTGPARKLSFFPNSEQSPKVSPSRYSCVDKGPAVATRFH